MFWTIGEELVANPIDAVERLDEFQAASSAKNELDSADREMTRIERELENLA